MTTHQSRESIPIGIRPREQRFAAHESTQFIAEFARTSIASIRISRERFTQHRIGRSRKSFDKRSCARFACRLRNLRWLIVQQSIEMTLERTIAHIKWRSIREQVVEQRAKTPHITARINGAAARLFGAHIRKRAHRSFGCRGDSRISYRRDAKVDHLRRAVKPDNHIAWLDVTMNHTRAMRVFNRIANRCQKRDARNRIEFVIVRPTRKRDRAFDEFHHDERRLAIGFARANLLRACGVHARNVGMLEATQRFSFNTQSSASRCAQAFASHDLDGDATRWKSLHGRVHSAHAASADHALERAATNDFADE